MAINIPSKFGNVLSKSNKKKSIDFDKLTEKLRFERDNIQPYLTNHQFVLYHHSCDLFVGNYYHGKNHFLNVNFTSNENEEYPVNRDAEYDEVGKILAHI